MPKTKNTLRRRLTIKRDGPDPIDVLVGQQMRIRRTLLGMSQESLGELLGVSFQQVQKYEKGGNRLTASSLWKIASILNVPIIYFFETSPFDALDRKAFNEMERTNDPIASRETLEFVRALSAIEDPNAREGFADLVRSLASVGVKQRATDRSGSKW